MRSVTTRKFFCWGCYSRHNSGAGCNFGCWNRRHSFLHTVLLSAAQFGSGFWGWVLLSSAQFAKNAVVIYSTVCRGKRQDFCKIDCYPAHNSEKFTGFLGLLSAAHFCCRAKIKVVMYGTFPKILPAFPLLLFAAHFPGGGLLFTAQFTVCIISFLQRRVLLFAAHFAKNHCLACLSRCYSRHNSRKNFCWGCYSAHNSAKILLLPGRLLVSTRFQEFSPGVVIHSTI